MPPLRELQLRFAANLLDPAGRYAAAHVLEGAITADQRIGFYRTNVISNFRDTLLAVYPSDAPEWSGRGKRGERFAR